MVASMLYTAFTAMRIIVGTDRTTSAGTIFRSVAPVTALSIEAVDDRLRMRRSNAYVEVMRTLDAGSHVTDRTRLQWLIDAIRQELPELAIEQLLIGIVCRCYLGNAYEVHTLDLSVGDIIQHYKVGQRLPEGLERARGLALHPSYAFIEVYSNSLRAVSEDGTVSVVEGR